MSYHLRNQATISHQVSFSGIGVHSGVASNMTVYPAEENMGIIFKRTDILDRNNTIKLTSNNVIDSTMCTKIANDDGISVNVIEHFIAACRIAGITNAIIEIDAPEVPILDGSAISFLRAFNKTGIMKQKSKVPALLINQPIKLDFNNGFIAAHPSTRNTVTLKLDYNRINNVIGSNNSVSFKMSDKFKLTTISKARTFGWLEDCEKIRNMGMAQGASLENTVIICPDNSIINKGGLRTANEIINHKALDFIGDFSVFEYDIVGQIEGLNTSHSKNSMFLKKLLSEVEKHTILLDKPSSPYSDNHLIQQNEVEKVISVY